MSLDVSNQLISRLKSYSSESISKIKELGQYRSYSEIDVYRQYILNMYSKIDLDIAVHVPNYILESLSGPLNEFVNIVDGVVEDVYNFDYRDETIDSAKVFYEIVSDIIIKILSVTSAMSIDYISNTIDDSISSKINDYLSNKENQIDEISKQIFEDRLNVAQFIIDVKKQKERVDSFMKSIEDKASKVLSGAEAKVFSDSSLLYKESANRFLVAFIVMSIVVVSVSSAFLYKLYNLDYSSINNNKLIVLSVSKAFIISFLCYVVSKISKLYFSAKHNSIVNEHRSNAILSYRALNEITVESTKRDEILNTVASAVFSNHDSGYSNSYTAVPDVATTVIGTISKTVIPDKG